MAKSKAFAGIRGDVLAITKSLPEGSVTTFAEIGGFMGVMPRHVAYILATLRPDEQAEVPWFRVVGKLGKLGKTKSSAEGDTQAELLAYEGVEIRQGGVADFPGHFRPVADLDHGVLPGKRYG